MIGKIVVLLVLGFAIAVAPTAAASEETTSDGGGGECVWTSSSGGRPGAGANVGNCVDDSRRA